jgi:hypothetical protein
VLELEREYGTAALLRGVRTSGRQTGGRNEPAGHRAPYRPRRLQPRQDRQAHQASGVNRQRLRILNDRKVSTPTGKPWSAMTVIRARDRLASDRRLARPRRELALAYHPAVRRFGAGLSGRAGWLAARPCRHNGLRCFRGKSAATWRTISMISSATTSRLLASATLNK